MDLRRADIRGHAYPGAAADTPDDAVTLQRGVDDAPVAADLEIDHVAREGEVARDVGPCGALVVSHEYAAWRGGVEDGLVRGVDDELEDLRLVAQCAACLAPGARAVGALEDGVRRGGVD